MFAIFNGAHIIEKHITLSNKDKGPDHKASLNFNNFAKMVRMIRNYNLSFGTSFKKANAEEIKNSQSVRKSLVAKINIKKGEKFSFQNLCSKRPGNGLPPGKIYGLIGKKSQKNLELTNK